ncbi:uncharacterized protein LOC128209887 isoform X1 [Mya arenaria]|uniref:uncharacterized protein LOC128209887 isoform X1 n=1 Tax=Mya arenaria TaxID=6604 RepID=UPI0022E827D4|nr:uncharacterized protein LOC128209887 isoform X1 [Mya arenaria]
MATGFSASVLNAGDFEYDFPCTECQEHGLNSEAVYFCQQCDSQFCGLCVKQHDRFYQKHPIIGTEKNETWGKVKSTCKMHPGEEMTVFCSDHRQTCCVTCQKELHGQCQLLQHTSLKLPPRPSSVKIGETNVNAQCDLFPLKQKHDESQMVTGINHNMPYELLERKRFKIKLKKDKYPCSIYGITVLPGGEIIITDCNNSKIKLVTADYAIVEHVSVHQKPWEICAVSDNQVAVSTERKAILFFNVNNSKLKMDRKLKLFHDCDHVSYLADQLYVASNRTVYQYTLTGQRVRKMDGWDMWGFALNPDGNRLYITDFDNNRLLTTDMHGRGLAILADEDIKGPTDGRRLQICVIHGRPTLCII